MFNQIYEKWNNKSCTSWECTSYLCKLYKYLMINIMNYEFLDLILTNMIAYFE